MYVPGTFRPISGPRPRPPPPTDVSNFGRPVFFSASRLGSGRSNFFGVGRGASGPVAAAGPGQEEGSLLYLGELLHICAWNFSPPFRDPAPAAAADRRVQLWPTCFFLGQPARVRSVQLFRGRPRCVWSGGGGRAGPGGRVTFVSRRIVAYMCLELFDMIQCNAVAWFTSAWPQTRITQADRSAAVCVFHVGVPLRLPFDVAAAAAGEVAQPAADMAVASIRRRRICTHRAGRRTHARAGGCNGGC